MRMYSIEFELYDTPVTDGYELGSVMVKDGDGNNLISVQPKDYYMIFIAIKEILLGLSDYVANKENYCEISCADSSYYIALKKKKDQSKLIFNGDIIADVYAKEFLFSFYKSALDFCSPYMEKQIGSESVKTDLCTAFDRAKSVLETL